MHFDTDSNAILIDNHCSSSLSGNKNLFVGELTKVSKVVQGIAGSLDQVWEGTMKLEIDDDEGVKHEFVIPKSYYVPGSKSTILSPQHLAQVRREKPLYRGCGCETYGDAVVLYWNQRKNQRTCPLEPGGSNVASIRSSSGYSKFLAFCSEIKRDPSEITAMRVNIIPAEDDDEEEWFTPRQEPDKADFEFDGPRPSPASPDQEPEALPTIIDDEGDGPPGDIAAEFLQWHHRLGHISPSRIKLMAQAGILPRRLATCRAPICTSCEYGKATRKPWRTKSPENNVKSVTTPGQCVSIDQLVSTTPGLIAQLRGRPTKHRYQAATVFVDHASRLSYVHLQHTTSAEETVAGKLAFERFAKSHGVQAIQHYHADNGIFADNLFKRAVAEGGQTLSFCGVNAHWQNGVAKRRIRELQDHARTMLLHAAHR